MKVPQIAVTDVRNGVFHLGDHVLPLGCLPIVLTGVVSEWKAMHRWTRDNLKDRFGRETVRCMITRRKSGFLQQTNREVTLPFGEFLDRAFGESEKSEQLHYLRIGSDHPLFDVLSADFEIPPLLDRYNPSATGIWIGQEGNVTPFHHDWWYSFLAQVSGHKRYTLVHPMDAAALQEQWPAEARYDLAAAPIVQSEPDDEMPNVEIAFQGILRPGDMLCIPPFWYHQIDTLDDGNISMPIRFDTHQTPDTPLFQLSQDSSLRPLTNRRDDSPSSLIERLKVNRQRFRRREEEFVEAFHKERNPGVSCSEVLQRLGGETVVKGA